jgi:hypothetical protein
MRGADVMTILVLIGLVAGVVIILHALAIVLAIVSVYILGQALLE